MSLFSAVREIAAMHGKLTFFSMLVLGALLSAQSFSVANELKINYDSRDHRDPMVPLIGPEGIIGKIKVHAEYTVEGILIESGGETTALINDELVRVGETTGNAIVVEILSDRVILAEEGEERVIWLHDEIIQIGGKNAATGSR